MKKHFPIHRTRIKKDIIAEFAVPPTERLRKKGRVAIIAKGAPGMPGGGSFLEFLAREGFYAISPRYRGTWESSGVFLKDEPTKDIKDVVGALEKPLVSFYEQKSYVLPKNLKVYIFAGSFGGPAAFLLSKDPRVTRVFAYTPVVDWRAKMQPMEEFKKETQYAYGEAFRADPTGWKKLKSGKFYNPATSLDRIDGSKIHIFHAKDDEVINYEPVATFAKTIGATLTTFKTGGHGGASNLADPRVWNHIEKTL